MIPIDVINPLIPEHDCRVTVEGRTIPVRGQTLYYAAIAYDAEQKLHPADLPALNDDTVLRIKVEDEDSERSVRWGDVARWASKRGAE
jgi:hypothetical protein